MSGAALLVHATAVAIKGRAILLMGPSGCGKSDLALRLIDRGAQLVCDDYCDIIDGMAGPEVHAKKTIAGKIELRGVGIIELEHVAHAPLSLVLQLDAVPERLPSDDRTIELQGWSIPAYALAPFEASAPLKVEMLLQRAIDAGRFPMRLHSPVYNQGSA